MSSKVYCDLSISADGYLAGPGQTADKPFGDGPVDRLHAWMIDTPDENDELRAHIAPVTLGCGRTPLRRGTAVAAGAAGRPGRVARHPHQLPRPPLTPSSRPW